MAKNAVWNQVEAHHAARRDVRRVEKGMIDDMQLVDPATSPSVIAANRELLEQFRQRLTEEERRLVADRAAGRAWAEIAASVGESPIAVRIRHARAIDQVARELGLDEWAE